MFMLLRILYYYFETLKFAVEIYSSCQAMFCYLTTDAPETDLRFLPRRHALTRENLLTNYTLYGLDYYNMKLSNE